MCDFVWVFVSYDVVIVFGLVCGIDGVVYCGVLEIGMIVVVVGGVDIIYLFEYVEL